jgi:hypothetical protein
MWNMVCPFFIHQLYCLSSRFVGQSLGSVDHGLFFLSFCHCLCQSFRFCVAFCGAWFVLVLHSALYIYIFDNPLISIDTRKIRKPFIHILDGGSIPVHAEVYSIQHYVRKFVSDMRQVSGFFLILRFRPPIALTDTI